MKGLGCTQPDAQPYLFACDFHTILFTLHLSHHHEQVARALIENGAAVNSQNEDGFSALMLSAQNGHEQV